MTQIIDSTGLAQEVNLVVEDYKAAFDAGLTLPQYLNYKYPTDAAKYGTAFEQSMASNGMFLNADKVSGLKPPSLADVMNGTVNIGMGPITRPDGNSAQSVSGRLLFPAAILELVESQLMDDNTSYEGVFNRMIATTSSVDSPRVDQPIINLTAPRTSRSMPISQMSEPAAMVTISLSEKSFRLPTYSIGLEISDEAQKTATIDLVGIALREQAIGERAAMIDEGIKKMVLGDVDFGMAGLTFEPITNYDSTLTSGAGVMNNKAWVKWLRAKWRSLNIDWVICDLDSYLAIEGRTGRPIITENDGNGRITSMVALANPGIPDQVNFFILDDPTIIGGTTAVNGRRIVGIDSRRAIRKVTYSGAQYSAIEQYVMRKSSALRIDFSTSYFRLMDGAWKGLTI
jgi:hypothetical protein